jgi:hypothetical protein
VVSEVDTVAHEAVRNGVGVGVEVDAGFLGNDHGQDQVGVVGMLGQSSEPGSLDDEALGGSLARGAVNASVGGVLRPGGGLVP